MTCDICGEENAHFFKATSVTVCQKEECIKLQTAAWQEHCAEQEDDSA